MPRFPGTAARLASVLPDPETSAVATEFLDSLGLDRQRFRSWGDGATWLGERFDPGLRVLYISGHEEDDLGKYGLLPGQVHFLQKPFTPAALARKVREVLDASVGTGP